MRLTLRTLLAFIDHALEPVHAVELETKIAESPLAQNAMQRIDEGIARRDLGSPALIGRVNDHDANAVAEYLDNTMADDDIPLFEKSCFESDMKLVEVAAVHRILTIALTKPISVSGALKDRIKHLPDAALLQQTTQPPAQSNPGNNGVATNRLQPNSAKTDSSQNNGQVTAGEHRPSMPQVAGVTAMSGKKLRFDNRHREGDQTSDSVVSVVRPQAQSVQGLDLSDEKTNSVPEYLRDHSEGRAGQLALVAGLLVALLLISWVSIGSFSRLQTLFGQPEVVLSDASLNPSANPLANPPAAQDLILEQAVVKNPPVVEQGPAALPPLPQPATQSATQPATQPATQSATQPASEAMASVEISEPKSSAPPIPAAQNGEDSTDSDSSKIATDSMAPPGSAAPPSIKASSVSNIAPSSEAADSSQSIVTDSAAPPMTAAEVKPDATSSSQLGMSLLSWQPETKDSSSAIVIAASPAPANDPLANPMADSNVAFLRLVNIAEVLPAASRLIVPDGYRTEIRIQPGLRWLTASATDLQAGKIDEDSTAYARLRIGKAIVRASSDCNKLVLQVGTTFYKLTFGDSNATASLDLKYFPSIGVPLLSPDDTPAQPFVIPVVTIAAVEGTLSIQTRTGLQWTRIEDCPIGSALAWIDGQRQAPYQLKESPWWYRTSIERPVDSGAVKDLSLELQVATAEDVDKPTLPTVPKPITGVDTAVNPPPKLIEVLQQATTLRRAETAALAARTLALLGRYDLLFSREGILDQSSSRPHRTLIFDSIIQSLGIDPQRSKILGDVLTAYEPPRGTQLMNLFRLPTKEELEADGADLWVDALGSPLLDERSLAIYQLKAITGMELAYQPDRVTNDAIVQWRKLNNSKKIQWGRKSIKPIDM